MALRVFGIAGWKNSGKTTLTERLVSELAGRGWKVSTVKHAHHAFDIDKQGSDSFRHRKAGAVEVAVVSENRWALMHELREESEPRLETILARLAPCDIVLVEGYKHGSHRKLETRRREAQNGAPLTHTVPNIVAIAADFPLDRDFGSNQSKVANAIDSEILEPDAGEKQAPTFPHPVPAGETVPVFDLDDITTIASFIETQLGLAPVKS